MVRRAKVSWAPHPRHEELSAFAIQHPDRFVQKFGWVPEEDTGNPLKFNLRWGQRQAYSIFKEEWDSDRPVRIEYLKSRRVGLTSLFSALGLVHCSFRPNLRAGIVAHNEFRSKGILAMCKFFRRKLPAELRFPLAVDSNDGLRFAHNDAQIMVGTCNEPAKVRGDGLQWAHISEGAHMGRMYRQTLLEVATTVAPKPRTVVIIEHTGKGRGSQAHKHWIAAKEGANIYRPVFLYQFDDPTCARAFHSEKQKAIVLEEIQAIEPRLMEKFRFYKLTAEQMHYAYVNDYIYRCNQDYEYYCREFPFNDEEAWDSHGISFFGDNEIATMATRVVEPLYFSFHNRFINKLFTNFAELNHVNREPTEESGALIVKVWRMPIPGRQYVMGSDCSLGELGGHYSAGYVIDLETREMMCAYRGRIRPDEHAYVAASIGWIYNEALAGPEINPQGGGMQLMNDMSRLGYCRFYIWRIRDHRKGIQLTQRLGWMTNMSTRPIMLTELRKMFIDCAHERFQDPGMFRDKQIITEMRTFQKDDETGRVEATGDGYDDSIFGLAIAHRIAADEVHGGALDMYATYGMPAKVPGPFETLLGHYDAIQDGQDPCEVVNFLSDARFNLTPGGMEWLE